MKSRKRSAFNALRQFARDDAPRRAEERCELCSVRLLPRHRHLLAMESRTVACACDACALRFQNVIGGRFKLIPRDTHALLDFRLTDQQWNSLSLPIDLAFFFRSTPQDKVVALYPSPAGATESMLTLEAWSALEAANPVLKEMMPDVEALLVHRIGEASDYYLAPIDTCYKLVGLIRLHWRGLSGGKKVWNEIAQFFAWLEKQSRPMMHTPPRETSEEQPHA